MRTIGLVLGALTLAAMPLAVNAGTPGHHDEKQTGHGDEMGQGSKMMDHASMNMDHETGAMSVQGEVVDLGCYLGHGAKGEKHKSCAQMCIDGGMPMGLLTKDGTLYLLTMSHDDADPFHATEKMAAETVEITGPVHERDGMRSLEVTAVKKVAASS